MRPADVRRLFASIPSERQILTVNGLTYDYVHYRHNPNGIAELINNNHAFTPFAKRLDEDGKIYVQIRVWDCDIDMIEVLDETTGEYHPMWSTDPDYTGGLSRWEHHQYYSYLSAQNKGRARQKARIAVKAKRDKLRSFDDEFYKLSIRNRAVPAALMDAEERRAEVLAAQDASKSKSLAAAADELAWTVTVAAKDRQDAPQPPPQKGRNTTGRKRRENRPPTRPDDYGLASTAHITRSSAIRLDGTGTAPNTAKPADPPQLGEQRSGSHFKSRRPRDAQ